MNYAYLHIKKKQNDKQHKTSQKVIKKVNAKKKLERSPEMELDDAIIFTSKAYVIKSRGIPLKEYF